MRTLLAFVGMTLGSYVGWWLGDQVGLVTGCVVSVIGMGIGLYAGRRLWQRYEEFLG
jgi:hypothetical protein